MKPSERQQVVAHRQQQLRRLLLDDDDDVTAHVEGMTDDVISKHARGTTRWSDQRRQDPQRCRLAGAVWSEHAEDLAAADGEAETVDGADVASSRG